MGGGYETHPPALYLTSRRGLPGFMSVFVIFRQCQVLQDFAAFRIRPLLSPQEPFGFDTTISLLHIAHFMQFATHFFDGIDQYLFRTVITLYVLLG